MPFKLDLPIDDIIEAYQVNKMSLNEIGMKYLTSADIIKTRLLKAGIPLRSKTEYYNLNGINTKAFYAKQGIISNTEPPIIKKVKTTKLPSAKTNRFEIFARDGFRCRYCGRTPQEDGIKLCVEHIIPKTQGGANTTANYITACYNCNTSKKNRALLCKNKQIPSFIAITELR